MFSLLSAPSRWATSPSSRPILRRVYKQTKVNMFLSPPMLTLTQAKKANAMLTVMLEKGFLPNEATYWLLLYIMDGYGTEVSKNATLVVPATPAVPLPSPDSNDLAATWHFLEAYVRSRPKPMQLWYLHHVNLGTNCLHIQGALSVPSLQASMNSFASPLLCMWTKATVDDLILPVEAYHLYDRLGKRITHEERFSIPRIPAVNELCIQAGVNLPELPTKRRRKPVIRIIKSEIIDANEDDLPDPMPEVSPETILTEIPVSKIVSPC
ncbi:hypothetical protein IFM89_014661 [Coptis chinensis]|uniref:APO domain-containing protein n=1 Tax=Coptis chinensis TaxID=261450 RepID=A0A835LMZ1_9MAGN|nr:hypothetical protein IFM89_014661 [Coptis chinensis]